MGGSKHNFGCGVPFNLNLKILVLHRIYVVTFHLNCLRQELLMKDHDIFSGEDKISSSLIMSIE